jgi:hypothetical protein
LDGVALMTFPLVTMLRKGPLHLEQRFYGFVLPGLSVVAFVYIHLNVFAADKGLKRNDPSNRK